MSEHPDFMNLYKTESDPRMRIRLLALHHVYNEGKKYTEVSDLLKFERHTVSSWVKCYETEGIEGLRDRPGRGAKQKLPSERVPEFKKTVIQKQGQRGGGRLKGEDIRIILKDDFDADYSLSGVYELLKRCGMSWVSPRTIHPQTNPDEQDAFKKKFHEKAAVELPADADDSKIEIWFQDEMRVGQRGTVTRLWTEKGKRPCVVRQQQFISGYIFGAVCPEKDKGCGLIMPAANTEAMQHHLSEISVNIESGCHALIIADQAAWHTTHKLELPENISILPLPAYSPELNPVERIWEQLRQDRLSNRCFKDYEDIADACCEAWNDFISQKGKITSMCSRQWATW